MTGGEATLAPVGMTGGCCAMSTASVRDGTLGVRLALPSRAGQSEEDPMLTILVIVLLIVLLGGGGGYYGYRTYGGPGLGGALGLVLVVLLVVWLAGGLAVHPA